MADLYSQVIVGDGVSSNTVGQNTRKVQTRSDSNTESAWLMIYNNNYGWEGGEEGWTATVQPTASNGVNFQAIVDCIQTYCEIEAVVRANETDLSIKVRNSSVPYTGEESYGDRNVNAVLTALLQAHPGLGGNYTVYNGQAFGDRINWD